MVDTDFYSFTKCQSYSPDILAGDQTVVDNFGTDCTKQFQNWLKQFYSPVPTAAAGTVTDDMKAAVNYEVVAFWKGYIKEYKAKENWLELYKMKKETVEIDANVTPASNSGGVVVSSAYQTSPLSDSEG